MKHELTGSGKGDAERGDKKAFKAGFDQIDWSIGKAEREAARAAKQAEKRSCGNVNAPSVLPSIEEFISPIDQTVISDRGQLRRHNEKHGVTNVRDYGDTWFEKKGKQMHQSRQGATKADKADRIDAIRQTMARMGIRD